MNETRSAVIRLADYRPPAWLVESVDLRFDLDPAETRVRSRLAVRRNPAVMGDEPLALDGEGLTPVFVAVDGHKLAADDYRLDDGRLVLAGLPDRCTVETEVFIHPSANAALEGLYLSGGVLCTQCEAEGFRRITFFPDRPDVMSVFTVTLSADRELFPVLLANGNPDGAGRLDGGRHYARWHDPFPKPCYLFALVAGDLVSIDGRHRTPSGREVVLSVCVEAHNADKCTHALTAAGRAMRWDEREFGREYDLDVYTIVAVDDFNSGAMENKGLNIFNSKFVLARPDTATDDDFIAIESVVAHEYFHNWTGNRITCRDWFQLPLKEGLTVYRDQRFTEDETLGSVKRIDDVRMLRSMQFPEDAGPLAHPVRPREYAEIRNFYTLTVYEKGAEVVRMLATLLGRDGFRRGMDLYFSHHDGDAATVEEFVACMAEAGDRDLTLFMNWYDQAGTPVVAVEDDYDPEGCRYRLRLRQSCPPTPGQPEKQPFHIPVAVGLLDDEGRDLPLRLAGAEAAGQHGGGLPTTLVLELTGGEQHFIFEGVAARPVPSLLRGFSAPVRLEYGYSDEELAFLMAHDSDGFNRWEAGRRLVMRVMVGMVVESVSRIQGDGGGPPLPKILVDAFRRILVDDGLDPILVAETLAIPSEDEIAEELTVVDPEVVCAARLAFRRGLATALGKELRVRYGPAPASGGWHFERAAMGRRRLRNTVLGLLSSLDTAEVRGLAFEQYEAADNMTDVMGALRALRDSAGEERARVMDDFEGRWRDEPLVLDKWFALMATSRLPGAVERLHDLIAHPGFSIRNPNRVRAVIGSFARGNPVHFHAADGSGYSFVADRVVEIDAFNPQIAARLAAIFSRWRRYDEGRSAAMRGELERIAGTEGLSPDVAEIVTRSLASDTP